jgi:hypothetical protein
MGAFTALVTPKCHGVGFYAGPTHNNKMFAANGRRDDPTAIKLKPGCAFSPLPAAVDITCLADIPFVSPAITSNCCRWSARLNKDCAFEPRI